jgi:DNA-binding FadR family transcriptional regulator
MAMRANERHDAPARPDFALVDTPAHGHAAPGSAPFPAGDSRGLHSLVVQQLGAMIATGRLAAGERISVDDVCRDLSASRTVVREAMRVLEAKGMVRPRPKVGTLVLSVESWDLLDEDVIAWRVRGPERLTQLGELMDLRVAVEVAAVRACCAHASPEEVEALMQDCEQMRRAGEQGDLAAFTAADIAFHARLLTASGNLIFRQFVGPFRAVLHARQELATLPDRIDPATIDLHTAVATAIATRHPGDAETTARALIEASRFEVMEMLGRPPSP